eukprot:TRINITY_DN1371_c0_g1_i1.p1 TRINITY_DN1371_c0_g1~~TRINITY_DN1371_c0_g1_i1.p1  ORF type:complete len:619 (-),score=120.97 TRINITY_DN1371_c0_g1_i1:23-1879(-)
MASNLDSGTPTVTATEYFTPSRNAAFRASLKDRIRDMRQHQDARQRMREEIERRKELLKQEEQQKEQEQRQREIQERKALQEETERRVHEQLTRMRSARSAASPARSHKSPARAHSASRSPSPDRPRTRAYSPSAKDVREAIVDENHDKIIKRREREKELRAILVQLNQIAQLETSHSISTPKDSKEEQEERKTKQDLLNQSLLALRGLESERTRRLIDSRLYTPEAKAETPKRRVPLVPRCATAPSARYRGVAADQAATPTPSRLGTNSAHRPKSAPRIPHGQSFRQPDFSAAVAAPSSDVTATPASDAPKRGRKSWTPWASVKSRVDTGSARKSMPTASSTVPLTPGKHVSFGRVHVREMEIPTPSPQAPSAVVVDSPPRSPPTPSTAVAASFSSSPPKPASPTRVASPSKPALSVTATAAVSSPTAATKSAVATLPSPVQPAVTTSSDATESKPIATTTAAPLPTPVAPLPTPAVVAADPQPAPAAEPTGESAADEASRRRALLIKQAEERVKALRERQGEATKVLQKRSDSQPTIVPAAAQHGHLMTRASTPHLGAVPASAAATTSDALQAKIDAKLAQMRATPAAPAASAQDSALVTQLDSRIAALREQMGKK